MILRSELPNFKDGPNQDGSSRIMILFYKFFYFADMVEITVQGDEFCVGICIYL